MPGITINSGQACLLLYWFNKDVRNKFPIWQVSCYLQSKQVMHVLSAAITAITLWILLEWFVKAMLACKSHIHKTCVFVQLRLCVQHWNDSLGVLTYSQRVISLCSSKYYGLTTRKDIPSCLFSVLIFPLIVRGQSSTDVSHIWLYLLNFPRVRQNHLQYRIKITGQAGLLPSHSIQCNPNVFL